MSLPNSKLKALLVKAIDFFDVTVLSKMDLITKGDKTVYLDPLGNKTQPIPSDAGPNTYYIHGPNGEFRQEIHFQNGSPQQGVNGVSNEAILSVILHRLVQQNEVFPSPYNVAAIYLLQGTMALLHARVRDRIEYGIHDTKNVNPTDETDALTSKNLATINSIGIMINSIFKFDVAYALNQPGKIHQILDQLIPLMSEDENEGLNIGSAFSFMSSAAVGSGVIRAIASVGAEFIKVQQSLAGEANAGEAAKDNPANNAT